MTIYVKRIDVAREWDVKGGARLPSPHLKSLLKLVLWCKKVTNGDQDS